MGWAGGVTSGGDTIQPALRDFGLVADGQHHLEVRLLRLATGELYESDGEPGPRQERAQRPRREAGVALAVRDGDLLLLVPVEREEDEAAPRSQHPRALLQGLGRVLGVRQRVEDEDGVERRGAERQLVHVGDLCPDVGEPGEPLPGCVDHALAGVDAGERAAVGGEGAGRGAVAGSDVEHVAQPDQRGEAQRERLPGAPRRVVPLHLPGEGLGERRRAARRRAPAAGAGRLRAWGPRRRPPRPARPWPSPAGRRPRARRTPAAPRAGRGRSPPPAGARGGWRRATARSPSRAPDP